MDVVSELDRSEVNWTELNGSDYSIIIIIVEVQNQTHLYYFLG